MKSIFNLKINYSDFLLAYLKKKKITLFFLFKQLFGVVATRNKSVRAWIDRKKKIHTCFSTILKVLKKNFNQRKNF